MEPGALDIRAGLVIVAAGAIQSPALLQRSAHPDPYDLIGRGLVLHTSLPIVGMMDRPIANYRGITGTHYSDHYRLSHGFYFACLFGHPNYAAALMPGVGRGPWTAADHVPTPRSGQTPTALRGAAGSRDQLRRRSGRGAAPVGGSHRPPGSSALQAGR